MILPGDDLLPADDLLPRGPFGLPVPPPSVYTVEITDLYGNVLGHVADYSALEVVLPINDDRSGKLTVSVYDPVVALLSFVSPYGHLVAALGRMARIKYRGRTLLWGIITKPTYSTDQATVQIDVSGPCYKLKFRDLNYSDEIVTPELGPPNPQPSDWTTVEAVVQAAYDTRSQYDENIPDIGVTVQNIDAPYAPAGLETEIQRGRVNWEVILEIVGGAFGGEFDVEPYDPGPEELPFDTTGIVVLVGP